MNRNTHRTIFRVRFTFAIGDSAIITHETLITFFNEKPKAIFLF